MIASYEMSRRIRVLGTDEVDRAAAGRSSLVRLAPALAYVHHLERPRASDLEGGPTFRLCFPIESATFPVRPWPLQLVNVFNARPPVEKSTLR